MAAERRTARSRSASGASRPPDAAAFTSTRDATTSSEVYVMEADGDNQTNVTEDLSNDADPAWSPVSP
jgi:Tol biopolymer transport system component